MRGTGTGGGLPGLGPTSVRWPHPWRALTDDESEALAFGRAMDPGVAPTVLGELRREVCEGHPLYGVDCRPVAWDAAGRKEFVFLTPLPGRPVAVVHFTWVPETHPAFPSVAFYGGVGEFLAEQRRRQRRLRSLRRGRPWWRFWRR